MQFNQETLPANRLRERASNYFSAVLKSYGRFLTSSYYFHSYIDIIITTSAARTLFLVTEKIVRGCIPKQHTRHRISLFIYTCLKNMQLGASQREFCALGTHRELQSLSRNCLAVLNHFTDLSTAGEEKERRLDVIRPSGRKIRHTWNWNITALPETMLLTALLRADGSSLFYFIVWLIGCAKLWMQHFFQSWNFLFHQMRIFWFWKQFLIHLQDRSKAFKNCWTFC